MSLSGNPSNDSGSASSGDGECCPFAVQDFADVRANPASVHTVKATSPTNAPPTVPPSKTDKPRPHVCTTCSRSFARLEHLKRHERSHTKEKPFECPECSRCFARRDLLLRHQQKLHQQGATSSKPRLGRRESTTGLPVTSGRVRKNSIASSVGGPGGPGPSMRPRANTISHIDPNQLSSLLAQHNATLGRDPTGINGHHQHPAFSPMGVSSGMDFSDIGGSTGVHGLPHGLPKLDTHLGMGMGGGLRTAPIPGTFGPDDIELEKFFGSSSTINPNQLHHFNGALGTPASPFHHFADPFASAAVDGDDIAWSAGLDNPMMFYEPNDTAIDGSSPSAISSASQSGFSEVMLDGSGQPTSSAMWNAPLVANTGVPPNFPLETMAPVFPELMVPTVSPKELGEQGAPVDFYFSTPSQAPMMSPTAGMAGMPNHFFNPALGFTSDSGSISSSSINGSARQSSVTSVSSESITDATRQSLLFNLTQALGYSPTRKYSQPQISSPLSAGANGKPQGPTASLPSTVDLQRFVNAYIQYFHPHLPFLHIPTLSFDTPAFTHQVRSAGNFNHDGMLGGGGCLILAMAAIGALYEFDTNTAKELFEAAKKMILYYLDERRRAGLSAAVNGAHTTNDPINKPPPLWLVQAMLLNLIFGHNCGDRKAAETASTLCAALVTLAKAATLDKPTEIPMKNKHNFAREGSGDVEMSDGFNPDVFQQSLSDPSEEHSTWLQWKKAEERKRTFFAVFSMSSLLVSAYAHAPRILNSEIRLDLPCEEDLWAADNAQAWVALGGPMMAQTKGLSFNAAMTYLLEARERQERQQSHMRGQNTYTHAFGAGQDTSDLPESDIRPSTFGCYVLINALHVYIWETRQRHNGRLWKNHEREAMHAQVEPALKAWQAAWRSNPHHTLERPNPYGPLSADCIPLLDLAYVRLFVNLVRSKELLWQGDFDGMASELAKGVEIVGQAEDSPERTIDSLEALRMSSANSRGFVTSPQILETITEAPAQSHNVQPVQSSKRERHLRKAAFYAADSLAMTDKLGATYADFTARELPNSSAMCCFDCAQILAEWVATIQDRVGRFIGILGKDDIDFNAVPAVMLLEEEDKRLLNKVADILHHADLKLAYDMQTGGPASVPLLGGLSNLGHCGYGTKLLYVTANMLEKAAVWPVTHIMARALEAHANHINQRAEASLSVAA
ncbi:hypothetical protein M011DRAFT_399861 [Sporormia fimetaria CBS 119925]|uniref:C2H2-type domain-containing protein n=1 Tax=Sporormia fimetaria CBS 119925 TaxID=1340428 RepID=A0A6A6VFZ0_9PLEO|nr:hypothetical protein M011DRAFT_399861 [Sporormia fimetaria CBS 119925]